MGTMEALLDAHQVTALLGVSRRTLESLIMRHEGPAYLTIGRQRRWRPTDVNAWIEFRVHESTSHKKLDVSNSGGGEI